VAASAFRSHAAVTEYWAFAAVTAVRTKTVAATDRVKVANAEAAVVCKYVTGREILAPACDFRANVERCRERRRGVVSCSFTTVRRGLIGADPRLGYRVMTARFA
jgi:hypothetical protein